MAEERIMPHKLTLTERSSMTMTGVSEVISFDENTVVLKTGLGDLVIHGQNLQLKSLSPEGGQVAVEGTISAFLYAQSKKGGAFRRLFG